MKFAMLAPLAAMTALTRGPIGPVRANEQSRALLQAAVEETVAVGVALKTGLEPADTVKVMQLVDTSPRPSWHRWRTICWRASRSSSTASPAPWCGSAADAACPRPRHTFITQALAPFVAGKPVSW